MGFFGLIKDKKEEEKKKREAAGERRGEGPGEGESVLKNGEGEGAGEGGREVGEVSEIVAFEVKDDGSVTVADSKGAVVQVEELPDGAEKLKESPHMKDVGKLNSLTEKAVTSAGKLYRSVEIVHKGAIPLDLVVSTLATAIEDFNDLKQELHSFQRDGVIVMDDIMDRFADIMEHCHVITKMVEDHRDAGEILAQLDDVIVEVQSFLELVGQRCKDLQKLRKQTAHTWLAATSAASLSVGGAAAALCVLSGGAALPALAPILAFGAGTTAVATASHVAFSPSLGAQIKDMDCHVAALNDMRLQAGLVGRKAEHKKKMAELVGVKPTKKFWW